MNDIIYFENYLKLFVALTGVIATFLKIKDGLSSVRKKQELKLDLEIFEKLKENKDLLNEDIEKDIKIKIKETFKIREKSLVDFFIGLVMFVGFGFWSIDIFQNSENFNGWIILTSFCSLLGLSMLFGDKKESKKEEVFLKIAFYNKTSFNGSIIIGLFGVLLTFILIVQLKTFSFWIFLTSLLAILGLVNTFRLVKKEK